MLHPSGFGQDLMRERQAQLAHVEGRYAIHQALHTPRQPSRFGTALRGFVDRLADAIRHRRTTAELPVLDVACEPEL
jgi:hypothetical protein